MFYDASYRSSGTLRLHQTLLLGYVAWVYLQNFVLPFLYSRGIPGAILKPMLYAKEGVLILVIGLLLLRPDRPKLNGYIAMGGLVVLFCVIGFAKGSALGEILYHLRLILFPFAALLFGCAFCRTVPLQSFLRLILCLSVASSIFGIIEVFFLPDNFRVGFANIAAFNTEVKGDIGASVNFATGHTGTSTKRTLFSDTPLLRLVGFGSESLSFGSQNALPCLIFIALFLSYRKKRYLIGAGIVGFAILLTQSRSCLLLFGIPFAWLMIQAPGVQTSKKMIFLGVIGVYLPIKIWNDLLISALGQQGAVHFQGKFQYFTEDIISFGNIIGEGAGQMGRILEPPGIALLTQQFGYLGVILFFAVYLKPYFGVKRWPKTPLNLVTEGFMIAAVFLMIIGNFMLGFTANLCNYIYFAYFIYQFPERYKAQLRYSP